MVSVGTDCSGIDAPIEALRQLKIPFIHRFSCEKDEKCLQSIEANYNPEIVYTDITTRDVKKVPRVDLYVCGFPCQPFSTAGRRLGVEDCRGSIFDYCLEYISLKQPKVWILENVKGLLTVNEGKTWCKMLSSLKDTGYNVSFRVLNTKDYGVPQNRERLYIVGVRGREFVFPKGGKKCKPLSEYVDNVNGGNVTSQRHLSIINRAPSNSIFLELAFGVSKTRSFVNANRICPCITANNRLWCVPKKRYATVNELLRLQGFKRFKQVVSTTQMKKQIGNSMSVNVLKAILRKLVKDNFLLFE